MHQQHNHKFLYHICDKDSTVLNLLVSGIAAFPGRSEITTSKPEKKQSIMPSPGQIQFRQTNWFLKSHACK